MHETSRRPIRHPARRRQFAREMRAMVAECRVVKKALRAAGIRARVSPAARPPQYHIGDILRAGVHVELLEVAS